MRMLEKMVPEARPKVKVIYVPCPCLAPPASHSTQKAIKLVNYKFSFISPCCSQLSSWPSPIWEWSTGELCKDVTMSRCFSNLCKDLLLLSPKIREFCRYLAQRVKSHFLLFVENLLIANLISSFHTGKHNEQLNTIYPSLVLHDFMRLCRSDNKRWKKYVRQMLSAVFLPLCSMQHHSSHSIWMSPFFCFLPLCPSGTAVNRRNNWGYK